jgi:membrane protein implicated in regulation of membrane protease activity
LIGTEAKVVSSLKPVGEAQYLVRSVGELWGATSRDVLQPGDTVSIIAVEGIRLVVGLAVPHAEDAVFRIGRGGISQRT